MGCAVNCGWGINSIHSCDSVDGWCRDTDTDTDTKPIETGPRVHRPLTHATSCDRRYAHSRILALADTLGGSYVCIFSLRRLSTHSFSRIFPPVAIPQWAKLATAALYANLWRQPPSGERTHISHFWAFWQGKRDQIWGTRSGLWETCVPPPIQRKLPL